VRTDATEVLWSDFDPVPGELSRELAELDVHGHKSTTRLTNCPASRTTVASTESQKYVPNELTVVREQLACPRRRPKACGRNCDAGDGTEMRRARTEMPNGRNWNVDAPNWARTEGTISGTRRTQYPPFELKIIQHELKPYRTNPNRTERTHTRTEGTQPSTDGTDTRTEGTERAQKQLTRVRTELTRVRMELARLRTELTPVQMDQNSRRSN
jgi:hypothetical protein